MEHHATDAAMKSVTFPDKLNGWATGRGGTIIKIDYLSTSMYGQPNADPSPGNYRLRNYPNPFRSTTTIEYSIPESSAITLTVYDVYGRKILNLDDGYKLPGTYRINLTGTGLEHGIYIYRLQTERKVLSKTMMLVK